mmetsp:Transcript_783/g.1654  ORF Transcript_783/g.1654 Transcript_783/m.1654 type:complete len:98 (-) Transcript_783:124-417(-)
MSSASGIQLAKQALQISVLGFASGFLLERNSHKLPLVPKSFAPFNEEAAGGSGPATLVRITGLSALSSPLSSYANSEPRARPAALTLYDGSQAYRRG